MPNFTFSFDKLLIYDPDHSRSTCNIFISHQSPVEEKNLGKLFILAEINSRDKINIDIINKIQEELKSSYYHTEDLNVETAFEKALEQVNQRIADMVGDYDTNWLDKLNIIAAIVKDDMLHFSYVGSLNTFLIRNERIINIVETTDQNESLAERVNPLKAFSNIISGDLLPNDTLFFCTSSLLDYISQEKLKRTVSENEPSRAIGVIENLLSENTTQIAFGALVIKLEAEKSTEQIQPATTTASTPQREMSSIITDTSQSSMDNLLQKKDSTGQVLTPSLSRYTWNSVKGFFLKIIGFIRIKLLKQSPRRLQFEKESKYHRPAEQPSLKRATRTSSFLAGLSQMVKLGFQGLAQLFSSIIGLFKKRDKIVEKISTAPTTFTEKLANFIIKLIKMPRLSKILLFSAVLVAFILAQGLFSSALSRQNEEQGIEYDQVISLISQKILKAESALLYGNEDGAKELLFEAQDLLASLPQKNKEHQQKIQELENDINTQLEKTRHIANMAAEKIASFTSGEITANIHSIVLLNNTLYTFDPTQKTIYAVDTEDKEVNSWPQKELENTWQYLSIYNNNLVFFDTDNGFQEFNTQNEKLSTLQFSLATDDANIISLATYENRVYLLDIKNNQIYRAGRITNGYGHPTEWLKDDTNLRESKSIVVDGNIYVLTKNGEAIRLFQGNRQTWSLSAIDPVLNQADKVWTDINTDNIFILDIKGKRIVEFTKEGKLVSQYVSESFTNLKDITVDWDNKTIYVLNENSILAIDILP